VELRGAAIFLPPSSISQGFWGLRAFSCESRRTSTYSHDLRATPALSFLFGWLMHSLLPTGAGTLLSLDSTAPSYVAP